MKKFVPLTLQANRIRTGQYGSDESYGLTGAFRVIGPEPNKALLLAISSGVDHEHEAGSTFQFLPKVAARTGRRCVS